MQSIGQTKSSQLRNISFMNLARDRGVSPAKTIYLHPEHSDAWLCQERSDVSRILCCDDSCNAKATARREGSSISGYPRDYYN